MVKAYSGASCITKATFDQMQKFVHICLYLLLHDHQFRGFHLEEYEAIEMKNSQQLYAPSTHSVHTHKFLRGCRRALQRNMHHEDVPQS